MLFTQYGSDSVSQKSWFDVKKVKESKILKAGLTKCMDRNQVDRTSLQHRIFEVTTDYPTL